MSLGKEEEKDKDERGRVDAVMKKARSEVRALEVEEGSQRVASGLLDGVVVELDDVAEVVALHELHRGLGVLVQVTG